MVVEYREEGKIALITINRPDAYNALNVQVMKELSESLKSFRDNPELWVGIITGTGEKAFSAGADVKEMFSFLEQTRDNPWNFPATHFRALELWKPLIAAVNGLALGGGLEVALACDIRLASENARFGLPEVNLGVIPGWGATQRLPRIVSSSKAAELLFMGKPIDAQEAYRIGLVNKVVPKEQLMSTAKEWAEDICKVGPLAIRAAKEAMVRGFGTDLENGLRLERSLFYSLLNSEDYHEGVKAFLEKRKPVFKAK